MKNVLYLFLCFFLLCFCAGKMERASSKPEFKDIEILCDTLVTPDSIALYNYKIRDSIIVVQTLDDEKFVKVINQRTSSFINETFDKGRAEDEFLSVNWIPFSDNNIGLYDIMKGFIYTFKLDKNGEFVQTGRAALPKLDGVSKPYSEIIPISETVFLMKSSETKEVYIDIFDIEKEQIIGRIETEVVKDKSINGLYYDFNMAYANGILFICYEFIDRVEFYDLKDNVATIKKIYGQNNFTQDKDLINVIDYYTYALTDGVFFYASRLGVPFDKCTNSQIEMYPIGEGEAKKIETDGVIEFFDVHNGFIYLSKETPNKDVLLKVQTR